MSPRALVVDDSATTRRIIGGILRDVGFDVAEAANGVEALERLGEMCETQLAIVDWNMPVLDGLACVQALRADPRYASLRILMVTTETEKESIVAAVAAGADEYLMKPFTREMVVEKLALMGFRDR